MILAAVILGFLLIFVVLVCVFLVDSIFGGQDFSSSLTAVDYIKKIVKEKNLAGVQFLDLGSSRGKFAVRIAKALPGLTIIGIDDSRFRIFVAKTRGLFLKNLKFKTGNIFLENVSSAKIVYLYLPHELMPALEDKLQKELQSGSLVISSSVSFPNWQPKQTFMLNPANSNSKKLFLYAKI